MWHTAERPRASVCVVVDATHQQHEHSARHLESSTGLGMRAVLLEWSIVVKAHQRKEERLATERLITEARYERGVEHIKLFEFEAL